MKKQLIRTTALTLAVFILFCPLCVCFAIEGAIVDLVGEEIINILWDTLKGWGIDILETGYEEITENVHQWLTGQLYEYLSEELHEAFDYWITGMQFYRDQFGRLIGNSKYIEAADQFADHLREAFGITNNSTTYLATSFYIDSIAVQRFPVYGFYHNANGEREVLVRLSSDQVEAITYGVPTFSDNLSDGLFIMSLTNIPNNITVKRIDNNTTVISSTVQIRNTYDGDSLGNWYGGWYHPYGNDERYILYPGEHYYTTDIVEALQNSSNVSSEGIYADSNNILLPSDDPNYQDGYSIIYYPDGTIGYIDINWPETISVDNLPAIVSTGSIRHLDLVSVFAPIKAFANTFSDSFDLMVQIIYNMPTEIVSIALTIMSAIAVFGTIKIFKEH